MKAAVIVSKGVLEVRDIPMPAVGPYDALCRLLYGATCTGTDQHLINDRFPKPLKFPTVLGHESIGRVVEVGPKARNFKVGDLVTRVGVPAAPDGSFEINWGGFAEYGIARDHWAMAEDGQPKKEWNGHRVNQHIPAGFDPAASTMITTWRETLSFMTRLGAKAGSNVLVIGSGGNGLAFVNHAANLGAANIAMIGSADREAVARAVGATRYFDYRAEDLNRKVAEAVPDFFDFAIDAVGKVNQINVALGLLKPGGTASIYGIDDWNKCLINPNLARGTFTYFRGGYDEVETHDRVIALIGEGKLQARHWLDLAHPFDLADIARAFEAVAERRLIKALVRLSA
jgi:threonine dehydrogenase-like Zn-dependent dehydrogenase